MLKLIGLIDQPQVYADGAMRHKHSKGFVIAYARTKRAISKTNATLQAERKAQWNGTLHTNGGPWFDGK